MDPKREEYEDFLRTAMEKFTVSSGDTGDGELDIYSPAPALQKAPCENTFRVIMNALIGSHSCDRTGKVSIACARHGCYAPNALVDLFKGEQQKNVDFAFLKALETTGVDPTQGVMLMYDIACQYSIHLRERLRGRLPESLEIDRAIGLFHVHAHKDQCFFRYASSFIPGAGVVSGEILESLWSTLNSISPTVRTATLAHRAEVLDDHACDSNHKKALAMATYLCKRYEEATATSAEAGQYFSDVSVAAGQQAVAMWTREVLDAERRRLTTPSAMDIYAAHIAGVDAGTSAPAPVKGNSQVIEWLEFALMVEEKQFVLDVRNSIIFRSTCFTDWRFNSSYAGPNETCEMWNWRKLNS